MKIAEFLRRLGHDVQQISSRQLKAAAGLTDVPKQTFTDARDLVFKGDVEAVGWTMVGRSFVRADNPFLINHLADAQT